MNQSIGLEKFEKIFFGLYRFFNDVTSCFTSILSRPKHDKRGNHHKDIIVQNFERYKKSLWDYFREKYDCGDKFGQSSPQTREKVDTQRKIFIFLESPEMCINYSLGLGNFEKIYF